MVKVTVVFENQIAAPMGPQEFVEHYYLTEMGLEDVRFIKVEQESSFKEVEE